MLSIITCAFEDNAAWHISIKCNSFVFKSYKTTSHINFFYLNSSLTLHQPEEPAAFSCWDSTKRFLAASTIALIPSVPHELIISSSKREPANEIHIYYTCTFTKKATVNIWYTQYILVMTCIWNGKTKNISSLISTLKD